MKSSPARVVISVAVTCIVAAIGLAMTYAVSGPRIVEQERQAEQDALRTVLPDGTAFDSVDDATLSAARSAAGDATLYALYEAADASGAFVGWGMRIASRGYGGPIQMVLGLDRDGKLTGLRIIAMNETPGLGTRVQTESGFLEQFLSLPGGFTEKDVKSLDMLSGATKSSRGVRGSVVAAGLIYEQVLAGEAGK